MNKMKGEHMLNEIKPVEGFEKYGVNKKGEAFGPRGKLVPSSNGKYLKINVYYSSNNRAIKRSKSLYVHRLVANSFIPNPEKKPCVNHKDGNPLNNHVNNLEWCTYKENSLHALKLGLIGRSLRSHKCIFTRDEIGWIRVSARYLRGCDIARIMGVSDASVSNILTGKSHSEE